MTEADERVLATSVFVRSFLLYFEPIANFFKTKYLNEPQGNAQLNRGALGKSQVRVALPETASEFAECIPSGRWAFAAAEVQVQTAEPEDPIGQVELELADIWKRVLGVNSISRKDNFFDLGGHSMLLVFLYKEVQAKFQVAPPIRSFFATKNLSEMALLISYQKVFAPLVIADDSVDSSWVLGQEKKDGVKQGAE